MTDGGHPLIFSPWPATRISCSQNYLDPKSLKAMFPTKSPELFSICHTNTQNGAAESSLRNILAMKSCHQHNSVLTLCIFSCFCLILLKCVYPSHIHDFIHVLDFIYPSIFLISIMSRDIRSLLSMFYL